MKRLLPALVLVSVTACGLADDERDEENKYIYPTFSDKTFEAYCLGEFDLDGNGRISRYEAQRVVRIDCSGRGIASLADVAEFANLRELDCRGNDLVRLDVSALARTARLFGEPPRVARRRGVARARIARLRRQPAAAAEPLDQRLAHAFRRSRLRLRNARPLAVRPLDGAGRRARLSVARAPVRGVRAAVRRAAVRRADEGGRTVGPCGGMRTAAFPQDAALTFC